MRFKLFGIAIYVSFYFFAYVTLLLFIDKSGIVLATLISAAVHEMGHITAMLFVKCNIHKINISPGRCIIEARPFETVKAQVITLIFGPLYNIAAGACFLILYAVFGLYGCLVSAVINFALGIINLLPVCGLDMGSIILLLIKPQNEDKFIIFEKVFAVIICLVFTALVIFGTVHFSILILCFYFIYTAFVKI